MRKERDGKPSSCDLADAKHVYSKRRVSSPLKRMNLGDRDQSNDFPDEETIDLCTRVPTSSTDEARSDELIDNPQREKPPTGPAKPSREPSEALRIGNILMNALDFLVVVDESDLEERNRSGRFRLVLRF